MKRYHHVAIASLWIGCVSVGAHLLYSALGFNPTDDGFTLAYSQRLLDGQVPYRDFLLCFPALFLALHMPEVFFGGQYAFWLSRFVYFLQCACIAWFGTMFVNKSMGRPFNLLEQSAFALVSFTFCCNSYLLMVSYTMDGLFLCVLGLYFRARPSTRAALIGYFLLGAALLCKQSFVFMAPGVLLIFGDWRKWKCVLVSALPGLLYGAYLFLLGGLPDGLHQMSAMRGGFLEIGVKEYLIYRNVYFSSGLAIGLAAASLLYGESAEGWRRERKLPRAAGLILMAIIFGLATRSIFHNGLYSWAFRLFGAVCGSVVYLILEGGVARRDELKAGMAVALLAWSGSLSSWNSPILGSGMLMAFLFALSYQQFTWTGLRWRALMSISAALLAISAFHYARTHYGIREQPAPQLTCSIGDVLPGARLIRTNPNTYAFLADLNVAIRSVVTNGMKYAIIPDVAAHWVKAEQRNPLPVDWALFALASTPSLRDRMVNSLETRRSQQVVIVQKVLADRLQDGFFPLVTEHSWYPMVGYVRTHFEKIGETKYFDLYK